MQYTDILLKPLVSEKANLAKETANQVAFFVHPGANKVEIGKAVEEAFGVKVTAVNVVRQRAMKRIRGGRGASRVSGYKKAYVTLAEGHKIEFFEGV
jgi:large subunit ribosomal protein L23